MNRLCLLITLTLSTLMPQAAFAQDDTRGDTIVSGRELGDAIVSVASSTRSRSRVDNVDLIGRAQLVRAACCSLGESFTTNPSVDVSYSDAATGARQIKLLGLSGTYVQMLTENVPSMRGAALPYSLGYVPGTWMQSIQVSKGASSVKNGYESTTGQINIEYLKAEAAEGIRANAYYDIEQKVEANVDGNIHINDHLSTALLTHFENRQTDHDANHDGFMDMPRLRQYNILNRWDYTSHHWISHLAMRVLHDDRNSGQSLKHLSKHSPTPIDRASLYNTSVCTDRYEAQWKNAFPFDHDHNSSVALILHGSWHEACNTFGRTDYDVIQKNGYAQLLFETDLTERHNLSVGASLNHDTYQETYDNGMAAFPAPSGWTKTSGETTSGLYAQYTYKLADKLTIMPGIRWDYSNLYGSFFTPRLHLKYTPTDILTLRASAGKGYRSPHALAENITLLASGRKLIIDSDLEQEEAWNYGASAGFNIPIGGKKLELNAEYYYTHFLHQTIINFDGVRGAHTLTFENLDGRSFSHTLQVDATYPFFQGFTATAAFRLNDVKCTYDGKLRQKPLTSRYKALLTLSYKTPMDIWQFDVTGQLNGGGELYNRDKYPAYFNLQAQVTRDFHHFSLYVGGENLTNYRMPEPVINAHNPWSSAFDATQIWGPVSGAMAYVGVRFKLERQ